jgi:hypothetical protein
MSTLVPDGDSRHRIFEEETMQQTTGAGPARAARQAPFVRLQVGKGLYGVTKVIWREWPTRNWLSWVIAALFVIGAGVLIYTTTVTGVGEPRVHSVLRWVATIGLGVLTVVRLILEGTVSKPPPGQPGQWDKQLADPWWTTIHTLSGVVLGFWLSPLLITIALTVGWELLEIVVPGFGDEEINGNRLIDNLVAWAGWLLVVLLSAVLGGLPIPIV